MLDKLVSLALWTFPSFSGCLQLVVHWEPPQHVLVVVKKQTHSIKLYKMCAKSGSQQSKIVCCGDRNILTIVVVIHHNRLVQVQAYVAVVVIRQVEVQASMCGVVFHLICTSAG